MKKSFNPQELKPNEFEAKDKNDKGYSRREFIKIFSIGGAEALDEQKKGLEARRYAVHISGEIFPPPEREVLENIKSLCEIFLKFWPGEIVVNLVKKPKIRGADVKNQTLTVDIWHESYTDPGFDNEGEIILYHELAHGFIYVDVEKPRNKPEEEVFKAFKDMADEIKRIIPQGIGAKELTEQLETNSSFLFNIFDESTYVRPQAGKNILEFGHPYNGVSEFSASALTVFRYFAKEFSQKFNVLNPRQKDLIRKAGWALIRLVEYHIKDKKVIKEYLPDIDLLNEVFRQ